jgi:hypothetical protein
VNSSDNEFMQPSDEDPQGNVLTEEEQALIKMNDSHWTLNKEDTKPAAQPKNEDSSPSPGPKRRRLSKKEHESDHMKKLFATPEKWPAFEHHILTEAENPTIRWNQEITNYQPTDFLERYFDLPDNMTRTLMNDLADAKNNHFHINCTV